jgi:hypothetical protein
MLPVGATIFALEGCLGCIPRDIFTWGPTQCHFHVMDHGRQGRRFGFPAFNLIGMFDLASTNLVHYFSTPLI